MSFRTQNSTCGPRSGLKIRCPECRAQHGVRLTLDHAFRLSHPFEERPCLCCTVGTDWSRGLCPRAVRVLGGAG